MFKSSLLKMKGNCENWTSGSEPRCEASRRLYCVWRSTGNIKEMNGFLILPTVPVPLARSLGTATLSAQLYSHLKGKEQGYADGKRKRNSIHPLLQLMLTILM